MCQSRVEGTHWVSPELQYDISNSEHFMYDYVSIFQFTGVNRHTPVNRKHVIMASVTLHFVFLAQGSFLFQFPGGWCYSEFYQGARDRLWRGTLLQRLQNVELHLYGLFGDSLRGCDANQI